MSFSFMDDPGCSGQPQFSDAGDLYRTLEIDGLSEETSVQIMKKPCPECFPFENVDQNLCSICKHLRLRHLINCLVPHSRSVYPYVSIIFPENTMLSKGCPLCDILCQICKTNEEYLAKETLQPHGSRYPKSLILRWDGDGGTSGRIRFFWPKIRYRSLRVSTSEDILDRVQPEIQWSVVNNWLMKCTEQHDKCHEQCLEQPNMIRLIDVQRRKLIRKSGDCKFVALSYIWGLNPNPTRLVCRKSNAEDLERDGALDAKSLPRTIEDAIQVCKNIGETYLWVDRLCIVQDDLSQKHDQIEAMANIFSSAYLVLIVLDGNMETGIPGIQKRSTEAQMHAEIGGLSCVNELPSPKELIRHSEWATRGWTYQESVLARRKLYFSWAQVFLECNTDVQEEDTVAQITRDYNRGSFLKEREWSMDDWQHHLFMYTSRSLSYSSDIYNAISGISNALLPEPGSWLCGLPRRNFDEGLLWFSRLEQGYRTSDKTLLPRWSWSSVNGQIKHPRLGEIVPKGLKSAYVGTMVAWTYQEEDCPSSPKFVPVRQSKSVAYVRPRRYPNHRLMYSAKVVIEGREPHDLPRYVCGVDKDCQRLYGAHPAESAPKLLCFAIAWNQGCINAKWPFPDLTERTFLELGADLERHWQEIDYLERDIVLSSTREPQPSEPEILKSLDRTTLKGQAQTSLFTLKQASGYLESEGFSMIVDNRGSPAGLMYNIDKKMANDCFELSRCKDVLLIALSIGYLERLSTIRDVLMEFSSEDGHRGYLWKCVARNYSLGIDKMCEAMGPNGVDISYLDSQGSALGFIPVVHVMLAEWDGPVARRISTGWVFLTRWVKSNPQFKTVYLA